MRTIKFTHAERRERRQRMAEMVAAGETVGAVATLYRCPRHMVLRACHENGVTITRKVSLKLEKAAHKLKPPKRKYKSRRKRMIVLVINGTGTHRNGLRVSTHNNMDEVRDDILEYLDDAPPSDLKGVEEALAAVEEAFAADAKAITAVLDGVLKGNWTILTDEGYFDEHSTLTRTVEFPTKRGEMGFPTANFADVIEAKLTADPDLAARVGVQHRNAQAATVIFNHRDQVMDRSGVTDVPMVDVDGGKEKVNIAAWTGVLLDDLRKVGFKGRVFPEIKAQCEDSWGPDYAILKDCYHIEPGSFGADSDDFHEYVLPHFTFEFEKYVRGLFDDGTGVTVRFNGTREIEVHRGEPSRI